MHLTWRVVLHVCGWDVQTGPFRRFLPTPKHSRRVAGTTKKSRSAMASQEVAHHCLTRDLDYLGNIGCMDPIAQCTNSPQAP